MKLKLKSKLKNNRKDMKHLIDFKLNEKEEKYWSGHVGKSDDFGDIIENVIIDGKTKFGPWGLMTLKSWKKYGVDRLGTGFGQKYEKQPDGKWLKIEG